MSCFDGTIPPCWLVVTSLAPSVWLRAGFFFAGYRRSSWWWEATSFAHKVLVVIIGSLLVDAHPTVQMGAALAAAVGMHALVLYRRPLKMKRLCVFVWACKMCAVWSL